MSSNSFSAILSRTQQNLNRINERYGSVSNSSQGLPVPPTGSLNLTNPNTIPPSTGFLNSSNQATTPRIPLQTNKSGIQNHLLSPNSSLATTQRLNSNDVPLKGAVMISEDMLNNILTRLNNLEQQNLDNNISNKENISSSNTMSSQEIKNRLANLEKINDTLLYDLKDLQRQSTSIQQRLNNQTNLLDSLSIEWESKKSMTTKLDSWMLEHDSWRTEVDSIVNSMKREAKLLENDRRSMQESLSSYVTRYELEQVRDKVHLIAQQSIATSMNIYNESIAEKFRTFEREIAAIRAATPGVSEDTKTRDLGSPSNTIPSEMIIKGAVASEVLNLQANLHDQLESKIESLLKLQFEEKSKALVDYIHKQVLDITLDASLYATSYSGGGSLMVNNEKNTTNTSSFMTSPHVQGISPLLDITNSHGITSNDISSSTNALKSEFDRRVKQGKNKLDMLEKLLQDRVHLMVSQVEKLEKELKSLTFDYKSEFKTLQNKLEINQNLTDQSLTHYKEKCNTMEEDLKNLNINLRDYLTKELNDINEKFNEKFSTNNDLLLENERRSSVLEKIVQDCNQKLFHHEQLIDIRVKTHPIILQYEEILNKTSSHAQSIESMTKEIRENALNIHKIGINQLPLNDLLEIQNTTKTLLNDYQSIVLPIIKNEVPLIKNNYENILKRVETFDTLHTHFASEQQQLKVKLHNNDLTIAQSHTNSTVMLQELNNLKDKFMNHTVKYESDTLALKDQTGLISHNIQLLTNDMKNSKLKIVEIEDMIHQLKLTQHKVQLDQQEQTNYFQTLQQKQQQIQHDYEQQAQLQLQLQQQTQLQLQFQQQAQLQLQQQQQQTYQFTTALLNTNSSSQNYYEIEDNNSPYPYNTEEKRDDHQEEIISEKQSDNGSSLNVLHSKLEPASVNSYTDNSSTHNTAENLQNLSVSSLPHDALEYNDQTDLKSDFSTNSRNKYNQSIIESDEEIENNKINNFETQSYGDSIFDDVDNDSISVSSVNKSSQLNNSSNSKNIGAFITGIGEEDEEDEKVEQEEEEEQMILGGSDSIFQASKHEDDVISHFSNSFDESDSDRETNKSNSSISYKKNSFDLTSDRDDVKSIRSINKSKEEEVSANTFDEISMLNSTVNQSKLTQSPAKNIPSSSSVASYRDNTFSDWDEDSHISSNPQKNLNSSSSSSKINNINNINSVSSNGKDSSSSILSIDELSQDDKEIFNSPVKKNSNDSMFSDFSSVESTPAKGISTKNNYDQSGNLSDIFSDNEELEKSKDTTTKGGANSPSPSLASNKSSLSFQDILRQKREGLRFSSSNSVSNSISQDKKEKKKEETLFSDDDIATPPLSDDESFNGKSTKNPDEVSNISNSFDDGFDF